MVIIHTHSLDRYNYNTYMKIIFICSWCIIHLIFILSQLGLYFGTDYCCLYFMWGKCDGENEKWRTRNYEDMMQIRPIIAALWFTDTSSERTRMAWANVTCLPFLKRVKERYKTPKFALFSSVIFSFFIPRW